MSYYNMVDVMKPNIDWSVTFTADLSTISKREETLWYIQEFVLNSYFNYERDWQVVEVDTIAKILWVDKRSASALISRIESKIKLHSNWMLDEWH